MEIMSPTSNSTAGFWHWSSPLPYLFGGLALVMCIITMALIILACSYKKSLSNNESREGDQEQKPGEAKQMEIIVDSDEPKIVVTMAGDDNPTFLAKPKPMVCYCQKIEQV